MVPFSDTALTFIFRLIHVNVPIYHTRHAERRADSFTGADTAWLIKYVYVDMISKIRARHGTRNGQGYNSISAVVIGLAQRCGLRP